MDPRNGLNDRKGKKQKSTFWAYVLWLFGGLVGAHHLYLERDAHAFVYFSTFGGVGGIGWLRDIYRIPSYVADANEDARFIDDFKHKIRVNHKPPISTVRFIAQNAVAYMWAELYRGAIPQDEVCGINFRYLLIFTPLVVALGVWTVGNIGREQGSIGVALWSAYLFYPTQFYIGDDNLWLFLMVLVSSFCFDTFSKQWKLTSRKRKNPCRRAFYLSLAVTVYLFLIGCRLYFNTVIINSENEEMKFPEALYHFLGSPIWFDIKISLQATWNHARHQGLWATWTQLVNLTDFEDEMNAYKVSPSVLRNFFLYDKY